MTLGPRARLIDTRPRPRRPPARWVPRALEAPPPGRPYASTPLTPFAERITDLALAAAFGRPLPAPPIPTRRPIALDRAAVWSTRGQPRPHRLEAIGVAVEVELIFKRGEPDDAAPSERYGSLRLTIALSRNGLRIVSMRPAALSPAPRGGRLPPGLGGLEEVVRALLADLRRGDVARYALDEEDRRVLANDSAWAQVHEDGPPLARADEVRAMLDLLPAMPLAYVLDDIGVLARDERGRLYGLSLELDPQGATFALATNPLVSVRRIFPE